jgi:hypothetical protein
MAKLEDFRHQPGTKLRSEFGTKIMVIELAAGMIRGDGRPSGGETTVAIVSFETGKAYFWDGDTEVVPWPDAP